MDSTATFRSGIWYPILGRPCPLLHRMRWSIDWQIRIFYEKPDGTVPGGDGDFFFVNRHVRPGMTLENTLVTRHSPGMDETTETGCAVSAAVLPRKPFSFHGGEMHNVRGNRSAHETDWDFLVEWRDTLLSRSGVPASAPARQKVDALALCFGTPARYIADSPKNFTRGFHPVDVVLHGQHCTGQSSALAALCHTLGIPARTLNFSGHSVCEVLLDGRWLLYDNQQPEPRAGKSYMETVADPSCSSLTPEYAARYHWMMNTAGQLHHTVRKGKWPNPIETSPFNYGAQRYWRFNASGNGATTRTLAADGGHGLTLPLTPDTATALYPGEPAYVFKYNSDEPCRVTLTLPHTWYAAPFTLTEGMAVRKQFWLGSMENVVSVNSLLCAWPGKRWQFFKPRSSGWYIRINNSQYRLRDSGGTVPSAKEVHYGLEIDLPLKDLKENSLNEVALGSDGSGPDFLALRVYPDLLEPYAPPVSPAGISILVDSVVGTHVCDSYASHFFA